MPHIRRRIFMLALIILFEFCFVALPGMTYYSLASEEYEEEDYTDDSEYESDDDTYDEDQTDDGLFYEDDIDDSGEDYVEAKSMSMKI